MSDTPIYDRLLDQASAGVFTWLVWAWQRHVWERVAEYTAEWAGNK